MGPYNDKNHNLTSSEGSEQVSMRQSHTEQSSEVLSGALHCTNKPCKALSPWNEPTWVCDMVWA